MSKLGPLLLWGLLIMREVNNTTRQPNGYKAGTLVDDTIHHLAHGEGVSEESLNAFRRKPFEKVDNSKIKVRRRLNNEQKL